MNLLATVALPLLALASTDVWADACRNRGIELQVLGSGGPELTGARASSSYLIRRDGRASVLIDAGGGSALRFAEAGARLADLDLVLFTHFHVDHSADFPALVKSAYFQDRRRPLPVLGPAAGGAFPGTLGWLERLFATAAGAYAYLSDYLADGDGAYRLQGREVAIEGTVPEVVLKADGLTVTAAPLVHGPVPALGWRIEVEGVAVAFSGDTDGSGGVLVGLATAADLLVAHHAIPESATGAARALHMPPSVIGQIAADAKVGSLLLSHRMSRTLGREAESLALIRARYGGPVRLAEDLDCLSLSNSTGGAK